MTQIPSENAEQAALFQWAAFNAAKSPELRLLYAIPNGGIRDGRTAAILRKTGVKAGVPDVCLPVKRGTYGALYIEMKRAAGGRVSVEQKIWLNALAAAGNRAVVCKGWEQAAQTITDYLQGGKT